MPPLEAFETAEEYYGTFFHELGHATGHTTRLDRPSVTDGALFASHAYSKEELVAEMTAAFLSAKTGIDPLTIQNHAAYVGHWLQVLRGDSRMVVTAAGAAQRAADYILGVRHVTNEDSNQAE
jgi:antirestriction protein ArdC